MLLKAFIERTTLIRPKKTITIEISITYVTIQ